MYTKIMIPTDGSALSDLALNKGLELAAQLRASAVVLTVMDPFAVISLDATQLEDVREVYEVDAIERASAILEQAERLARRQGVTCHTLHRFNDSPYKAILEVVDEEHCDLIAMGSHGRSGIASVLLGSQTLKVLAHAHCPVVVLK